MSLSLRESLPSGEGGAERRVRVRECVNLGPHPALRATFSQREKDTPSGFSLIWTTVAIDRLYNVSGAETKQSEISRDKSVRLVIASEAREGG